MNHQREFNPEVSVLHACAGKDGFANKALANQIAERARRHRGHAVNTYRCIHCGQWHIGGVNPTARKRVIGRKQRLKGMR